MTSDDGGMTMGSATVILDMPGESQGQSHQISNVSIGPDSMLYVHNGDGFDASTARNLDSYRGKILRLDMLGSAPADNPFYDASDGINARDYVFAYGFRNPFGGAWRAADGLHYEVENGPSVDRFARVVEGVNYQWNGTNVSLRTNAIYNWDPAHAPVNITFVQPETFTGSLFPAEMQDRAFVSESGPTYARGPQVRGKRIVSFELDTDGNVVGGPETLVEYVGEGRATVVGLTAGPDGLYFTELYKDLDAQSPIDAGARVLRVRYTGGAVADFDLDGDVDGADLGRWKSRFGTAEGATVASGDADRDGDVDGTDFLDWQRNYTGSQAVVAAAETSLSRTVLRPTEENEEAELGRRDFAPTSRLASSSLADDPTAVIPTTGIPTAVIPTTGVPTLAVFQFDTSPGRLTPLRRFPLRVTPSEGIALREAQHHDLALAASLQSLTSRYGSLADSAVNDLSIAVAWQAEAEHDAPLAAPLVDAIDRVFAG